MANEIGMNAETIGQVARALMLHDDCGCTLESGERVFCHDERLPEHVRRGRVGYPCECQSGARVAIEAVRKADAGASVVMERALDRIERLGHGSGPGLGFTCAEIAAEALGRPLRRDSGSRRDGEDSRSGAEAEGRQNGSRSEIARDLPA